MAVEVPPMKGARVRIRGAALELMARKGIAGTTIQDIAKRANCSQAAIYKHWEGKEGLARELFEESHTGLLGAMQEGASAAPAAASEKVIGSLLGLVRYARAEPGRYAFLFQVFHSDFALWLASLPKPRDVVLEWVRKAAEAGEIEAPKPELKSALLLGMAIRMAFFERQNLLDAPPAEADEALVVAAAAVLES
jgi:AcrR family transcriptional regulator